MLKSESRELVSVVEEIRKDEHPEISAEFLIAVIEAEKLNPDNDEAASQAIEEALAVELARRGAK